VPIVSPRGITPGLPAFGPWLRLGANETGRDFLTGRSGVNSKLNLVFSLTASARNVSFFIAGYFQAFGQ